MKGITSIRAELAEREQAQWATFVMPTYARRPPILSQVRLVFLSSSLWHRHTHETAVARLRRQDHFRPSRLRGPGNGDPAAAGEMAQRLRPILLSDHRLRPRSSRRLQQRHVRRREQHAHGAAAWQVLRPGLSLADPRRDQDRCALRQGGRLRRRGQSPSGASAPNARSTRGPCISCMRPCSRSASSR